MSIRSIRLRRCAPLAGVAAVLLTAAACGDDNGADPSSSDPSVPSDDAQSALVEAGSTTLGEASMDFDLAFSVDAPTGQEEGRLEGTAEFSSGRGEVVATSAGIETSSVFNGDEFWLTTADPAFTDLMPDGKEWVHGSLSELGGNPVVQPLDEPLAILYLLNGAQDVTADESADGTQYSFDVDMDAAIESAPSDRQEEVGQLIEATAGELEVTGEAVVDSDRHVREMTFTGTITEDGSDDSIEINWDATLDRFGNDVTPEPPADDTVVALDDVPELKNQVFGAS